jgi:hypothetical protein
MQACPVYSTTQSNAPTSFTQRAKAPEQSLRPRKQSTLQEFVMAKGQKRSNREIRKPKAPKLPGAVVPALTKGMQPPIKLPKDRT